MKILILNGSPAGREGNCGKMIEKLIRPIKGKSARGEHHWETIHLARVSLNKSAKLPATLIHKIVKADALLFVTGTYWDSWGSPLQAFLEKATELEADPRIVGKPAGVVVLMHSVGGKEVLSRLQGVLSSFGFVLPPFTGMAHSLASQIASSQRNIHADDFWSLQDLEIILENLRLAAKSKVPWVSWPVDRKNFRKTWLK